jgi:hypothetical protein
MLYRHTNGSDKICCNTRLINTKTLTLYCTHPTNTHMCIYLHVCAHTLSLCYTDSINKRDRNLVPIYSFFLIIMHVNLMTGKGWWPRQDLADTTGLGMGESKWVRFCSSNRRQYSVPLLWDLGISSSKIMGGGGGWLLSHRGVSPILWGGPLTF